MGSFLSADATWAAQQLADMVPKKLKNLAGLDSLHDTERVRTAAQGKLLLIRHCANAAPTSWLRLNAPDVTAIAALTHDTLIDQPLLDVIGVGAADPAQRARALSQARMPLANFGGLGVASASSTSHAAYTGRFASTWAPACSLFPHLRDVDLTSSTLPSVAQLRLSHAHLMSLHAEVASHWAAWDARPYDHDTFGDRTFQFHPPNLPPASSLPTLADFSNCDSKITKTAQRRFTAVTNHHLWLSHYRAHLHDVRATTVIVCASQPYAGDFLNAVPTTTDFSIYSDNYRTALQRRLSLPLHPPVPPGLGHDVYGDSLQNAGSHGYRHDGPKDKWYDALVAAFGSVLTDIDPTDGSFERYSPGYRPDLVAFYRANAGLHLIADVKVASPFTTRVTQQDSTRAAVVAFASTEEYYHERILGRAAFERARAGPFSRRDNTGSRTAVVADYAGALALGHTVIPIIHEVFGGWGSHATRLFRQLARGRSDTVDAAHSSWAARSYTSYHAQRISVAIHTRSASEILRNLIRAHTAAARGAASSRGAKRVRVTPGTRRGVAAAPPRAAA